MKKLNEYLSTLLINNIELLKNRTSDNIVFNVSIDKDSIDEWNNFKLDNEFEVCDYIISDVKRITVYCRENDTYTSQITLTVKNK